MNNEKNYHKHDHHNSPQRFHQAGKDAARKGMDVGVGQDEITEEEEKWNPTPEQFEAFQVRDLELARSNIHFILSGRKYPITVKELKGSTLHSVETIEKILLEGIKNGTVQESKGEYSLVQS